MTIEVTQCSMCKHYSEEQYCEIWQQYITNDAFYCACGAKADHKTENNSEKPNNSTISKMEQVDKDINVRSKNEPQTNKDFKVTYTCSFTECDNFKNFGFGEKCIECKRKQSEAKHKDEPQTDCAWK